MAKLPYTPYATEEYGGGGGTAFSTRATPNDFGAQVGGAIEKAGKMGFDFATQAAEEAAEAKANDILANKWAPETTKLRVNFDSLQGADKVHGYQAYVDGLKNYQKSLVENETNPYTKKILQNYTTRYAISETESASRSLAAWQKQFNTESTYALIKAQNTHAANNYNNPALVNSVIEQNDAQITRLMIDDGIDPMSPDGAATIAQAQRSTKGLLAGDMITRAVETGDMSAANSLRAEYGTAIPAHKQLEIDRLLSVENIRFSSTQATKSLIAGEKLPQPVGAPAVHIQAAVADAASGAGIDPNTALAYIRIESADGTNTGKRGTLAQDKLGGSMEEQIARLPAQIKQNEEIASRALGRKAEGWEGYIVHQQGSGGGAALLLAAQNGDTRKAVDILREFEGKEKGYSAIAALEQNGGNSTMTAGDFVGFLKEKYIRCQKQAMCDFKAGASPGGQIMQAYNSVGEAVQPGANPIQALQNFNTKAPSMLAQIQAIPNTELRDNVMKEFERERSVYAAAEAAYTASVQHEAQQIAVKPDFTSVDQLPAQLRAKLLDMPETMTYMEARAEHNRNASVGSADLKTYGTAYFDLFKAVNAPEGSPDRITSVTQLQQHLSKGLTVSGYEKLVKELTDSRTPEGAGEKDMKKAFYDAAKSQISGKNDMAGIRDPKGEMLFAQFLTVAEPLYEKGRSEGKSPVQLLSEDSPDYIGKAIPKFKRSISQMTADMVNGEGEAGRGLADIIKDVKAGKITQEAGRAEAERLGLVKKSTSDVPRPE